MNEKESTEYEPVYRAVLSHVKTPSDIIADKIGNYITLALAFAFGSVLFLFCLYVIIRLIKAISGLL